MQSLDPDRPPSELDTLTPYATNRALLAACWEWVADNLRHLSLDQHTSHPMVITAMRLQLADELLRELIDLMLHVHDIAEEARPADAVAEITRLINDYEVPFYLRSKQ